MPRADPPKVIIHAGFHKTGTTTVQRALHANRALLAPYARILLKPNILEICNAALRYARRPSEMVLADFSAAVHAQLALWDPTDSRDVILSAEDLCGLIPGRRGRVGYPHAVVLLNQLVSDIGTRARPHLYFSTRGSADWTSSCYAHHVRHTRCEVDETAYIADQKAGADLSALVAALSTQLYPVQITAVALEQSTLQTHGPVTPLLDLTDIPDDIRRQMLPVPAANVALPRDICLGLLALNRSALDEPILATQKRALIANYKKAQR